MSAYTAHEENFPLNRLAGRDYKLIVGSDKLPCSAINGGVSFFPPKAHAPAHIHDKEEEVVYCLEGKGEIFMEGKPEPIRPGTFIVVPPGTRHSINNTGRRRIKLLYLFSPKCRIGQYADIPEKVTEQGGSTAGKK